MGERKHKHFHSTWLQDVKIHRRVMRRAFRSSSPLILTHSKPHSLTDLGFKFGAWVYTPNHPNCRVTGQGVIYAKQLLLLPSPLPSSHQLWKGCLLLNASKDRHRPNWSISYFLCSHWFWAIFDICCASQWKCQLIELARQWLQANDAPDEQPMKSAV